MPLRLSCLNLGELATMKGMVAVYRFRRPFPQPHRLRLRTGVKMPRIRVRALGPV